MINFSRFPRTNNVTYTIIHRYQAKTLAMALQLAGETDFRITSQITDELKPHIPDWFNPRYSVLVSRFDSQFLLNQMEDIMDDEDVEAACDRQMMADEKEHEENHKWVETEGVQPWQNKTEK